MKKFIALFINILSLLHCLSIYATIATDDALVIKDSKQTASVRSVKFESDGILVTYDFTNQAVFANKELYGLSFYGFDNAIIGDTLCTPKRTDSFIIPFSCVPKVEILQEIHHDIDLSNDVILSFKAERDAGKNYFCSYLHLQKYRQYPVAMVEVCPLLISESKNSVSILDKLQYKIYYNSTVLKSINTAVLESESLVDPNGLYSTNSLTPILPPGIDITSRPLDTPGYLILSVPKFKEHLEPFVKWKKLMGYTVYEAYDNNWSPESIKTYIRSLYAEHNDLQYILIVGDHSLVPGEQRIAQPFKTSTTTKEYITDFYYGCMKGDDALIADIYRGRWPIRTVYELENIIEKSIRYEMEPSTDPRFYSSAAHFGYFEDEMLNDVEVPKSGHDRIEDKRFVHTCEDIRDYIIKNNLLANIDRLYAAEASHDSRYMYPWSWD